MSKFEKENLKNLEKLCRIRCSEEEEEKLLVGLKQIIEYIDLLNEVDTKNTPTCQHVLQNAKHTPLREDTVANTLSTEEFLSAAPDQIGGMVKVPPVLKSI